MLKAVTFALCCTAGAASAAETISATYLCDRGAQLSAVYVNDITPPLAIMMLEGRQVVMTNTISASGAFYQQFPEGEAGYFWRTKGSEGNLVWRAADGTETPLLNDCAAAN